MIENQISVHPLKAIDATELVGNTPVIRYVSDEVPNAQIWIKLEGTNPTGSVKDRACVYIIRGVESRGELRPGMTLLDASSGNMACSMAYFGRILGYKVAVVCNSKLTKDKAAFMEYFGAKLYVVGDYTIQGNRYCREVLFPKDPQKYCFLDQLHNWDNPKAHVETTGPEIARQFPDMRAVVGSLGSGGLMNGVGRFIKQNMPNSLVICVEAASGTKLPGTSAFVDGDYVTPFIEQGMNEKFFDSRIQVSANDARRRTAELAAQGVFCGFQTGGVLHAAILSIKTYGIEGDVVAISGDTGWKNMSVLMPQKT